MGIRRELAVSRPRLFETPSDPLDLPPVHQLVNPSQTMPVVGSHWAKPGMRMAHVPAELAETNDDSFIVRD
jgi:hypothetical protein